MKKLFLLALMTTIIVVAGYSQTGIIRALTGEVLTKPVGAVGFLPVEVGAVVVSDTVVSTGFRSTAIIVIGSTTITVRPLTRLSLADIQSSSRTENLDIRLETGRIRVDVRPAAGTRANTRVQTPVSVASVRGTGFEIDLYNIVMIDGTAMYGGNDNLNQTVSGDDSSMISNDGVAQDPVQRRRTNSAPSTPVGTGEAGETQSTAEIITTGGFGVNVIW